MRFPTAHGWGSKTFQIKFSLARSRETLLALNSTSAATMKKALSAIGQFMLFLLVFLAGSLANPLHLKWSVTHPAPNITHYFVPDGLLIMVALYLVFLCIALVRKRLTTSGLYTTAAFALALILGLLAKFGSVTHDIY